MLSSGGCIPELPERRFAWSGLQIQLRFFVLQKHYSVQRLRQHSGHHVAKDVRQTFIAALMEIGQKIVVHADQVEDGGVQIVQVNSINDGFKTEFVNFTVGRAAF